MLPFMKETQHQWLYKSVPDVIRHQLESADKKGYTYTFELMGRQVVLHMVFPKPADSNSKYSRIYESEEQLIAFFDRCVHRISVWLGVAFPYGGQQCANHLTCYLFFTDHTKILPKNKERIGKEHFQGVAESIGRSKSAIFGRDEVSYENVKYSGERSSQEYEETPEAKPSEFAAVRSKSTIFAKGTFGRRDENSDENQGFTGKNDPIDTINANTALTTSCKPTSIIMLYRIEEWFKVFIHETFHSLGLDFSEMDIRESNQQIAQLFHGCNRGLDVRVYETYCEMWAVILHTLFLAYFSTNSGLHTYRERVRQSTPTRKRSADRYSRILSKFERMIRYERAYTMFQAAKVLHHYGIEYRDLCENRGNNVRYTEPTPVFSYYIVKSVLFFHINDFLDWCYTHNLIRPTDSANSLKSSGFPRNNGTSKHILYFTKKPATIREYGRLIGRLYKSDTFIQKMDQMRKHVEQYTVEHPRRLMATTLRMSLHET